MQIDNIPENTLDLRDELVLVVETHRGVSEVIDCRRGEYPERELGLPVTDFVLCRDQEDKLILVTTDMDSESLVIEFLKSL